MHRRCTGQVRLRVTAWPSLQPVFIERFHSKEDVINACLASGHLPFLLDGRLAATMRGGLPGLASALAAHVGCSACWCAQWEIRILLHVADLL